MSKSDFDVPHSEQIQPAGMSAQRAPFAEAHEVVEVRLKAIDPGTDLGPIRQASLATLRISFGA